jgi:8-oxo-dGTP pyrophosphatase MutT (NUDIX family)
LQGEEYADTAARELQEEIGMPLQESRSSLQELFIFPYKDETCHVFGCAFKVTWDGPATFADAEVEWGRFTPLQELQQLLQQQPEQFTPVGRHILGLFAAQQQEQQQQQY